MFKTSILNLVKEHRYFSFVILVFFVAEIIVCPTGDFPLNDDWSYAKAVLVFNDKAEFNFGLWPAMTLASHILWGSLFTKLFGFSHFVLRLSSLVSALISTIFLYRLLVKSTHSRQTATIGCAVLLFNPIFFSLANTYMTDVNFCTLAILSIYFAYRFYESGKAIYFLPVFLFSALLVLVRQFGIVVPVAFVFSCFFIREKKIRNILLALLVLVAVLAVLKIYEDYLHRILPRNSTYKFSGKYSIFARAFWDTFFIGVEQKWGLTLLHMLVYSFPFALIFLKGVADGANKLKTIIVASVSILLSIALFWNTPFPWQNIFRNMHLGAETFYQSTQGKLHAVSEVFGYIMTVLKFAGSASTLFLIIMLFVRKRQLPSQPVNPYPVFMGAFLLLYAGMLFITESDFDRYYLPLVIGALLILAYFTQIRINAGIALIPLVLMVYISVAGTKDYFTWNEKRWEAFNFLNKRCGVSNRRINAGFEPSCWTDNGFFISFDFLQVKRSNFLIQFDQPDEDFRPILSYEFQRYFLPKKDKINIFVRVRNINSYDKPSSKKR